MGFMADWIGIRRLIQRWSPDGAGRRCRTGEVDRVVIGRWAHSNPARAAWLAMTAILTSVAASGQTDSAPGPSMIDDLRPIGTDEWNLDRAGHLLERAGFGGTPEEIRNSPDPVIQQFITGSPDGPIPID